MARTTAIRFLMGLLLSAPVWGQALSTINGTVTDPTGAAVPGAKITATEVETRTSRTTTSNSEGLYVLSALRPTAYTLAVEGSGFRTVTQTGITLQANDVVTINLRLELGTTSESITVESSAVQTDTTTATLRQVVDAASVAELPLNGRNAAQLTTLVAGAVLAPANSADQGVTKTFPVAVTVSINGTRSNQVSYSLDGIPNNELLSNVNLPFPMPDALQEFSIQTSNYGAEYGQNAGGVVNIVTKAGTNEIHGSAFGYVRNAVFNARDFFAVRRDPLKRAQYGATLGGPIRRDKAFFFFGYQGTRLRTFTGGLNSYVPTQSNLAGDFSALLSATNPNNPQGKAISLKDPASPGTLFPNNQVPLTRLDPASLAMSRTALPAAVGNGLVFYSRQQNQDFSEYTSRVDYSLSNNDRLAVRHFYDSFHYPGYFQKGNMIPTLDYSDIVVNSGVVQETHIFSPELLNEFRFGVMHQSDRRGPPAGAYSVRDFGVNMTQGSVPNIEEFTVTSYFSAGGAAGFPTASFPRYALTWADTIRYVRGRHSLSFGGSFERARLDEISETNKDGAFSFSGDSTGVALADFMLGKIRNFRQGNGTIESNRHVFFALFAQDTLKVNSRLSLNFGLRWEPSLPWHDKYQTGEIFSPAWYVAGVKSTRFVNAPRGELFAGDPGVPQDGRDGDWNNVSPRFGFAYDVFGNGKTSVRGGAGMFFDARVPGWNTNKMSQSTPFTLLVTMVSPDGPFSDPYRGRTNPFPSSLPPPKDVQFPSPVQVWSFDPIMRIVAPVTYNGNLTIEQQLKQDWLVRVAYVFSRSNHINVNQEMNPAVYTPGSTLTTDARRTYQGFSSIAWGAVPAGNAWYNGLQLSLQKRMSRGFTVLANYTWSKTLDNIPNATDATNVAIGSYFVMPATMPGYKTLDRGPSDYDRAHVASVSYVWSLPSLSRLNRLARGVAGGWQLNGIVSRQSGSALTIAAGQDRSQTGIGRDRAVLVSDQALSSGPCSNASPCMNWLNPAAFAVPALGSFGNLGKGVFRGPGVFNMDMTIGKLFQIHERFEVRFRAEFFNLLNHENFNNPAVSVAGAGFGQIRSGRDPRIGQLALKLSF